MKKIFVTIIIHLHYHLKIYSNLERRIINFLNHFPSLKLRLKRMINMKHGYASYVSTRTNRELLIDITHLYTQDLKTGIQRVVRSILNELENSEDLSPIDIQPIFLTDKDGFWCYKYVKEPTEIVVPKKNDIFFGLDLNGAITAADISGLLSDWKERGPSINFVVYDILPISHPHWWPEGTGFFHEEWFKSILKYADKIFCISESVSKDVETYLLNHISEIQNQPIIDFFHLGADIDSSMPSKGIPEDAEYVLNRLGSTPSFLSVGTIEPRKGYKQTLSAFEKLWEDGMDINFVIVGKQGWMVDELAIKMRNHPERNQRLFWLEGVSDEYLEKIYAASTCLIASSEGEGFGLPLIEAAQHKLSIIARDIPVFREVAGDYAYYFINGNDPSILVEAIHDWLALYHEKNQPKSDKMPWIRWRDSATKIIKLIDIANLNGEGQK